MTPIKTAWESYRDTILPKDAPEIQILECRRAFYAGAWTHNQITTGIGNPDVTEEMAMRTLDAVQAECRHFAKDQMNPNPERN